MSASLTDEPGHAANPQSAAPVSLILPPLLIALLALAGSLWLSVGMGLKACPLCFYQRTFVMGVVAILGIGVLTGAQHRNILNVLALPLAVAGVGVAAFHVYLELSGKLECPGGVMGVGTAPQQSFALLAMLLILVGLGDVRGNAQESNWPASMAAVVMGVLLAWSAIASAPPMPPTPTKAYDQPLEICRPPFRPH